MSLTNDKWCLLAVSSGLGWEYHPHPPPPSLSLYLLNTSGWAHKQREGFSWKLPWRTDVGCGEGIQSGYGLVKTR